MRAAAPATKTGKRVAVVGSGPAGLACAQQLARAGHDVVRVREERPHRRPAALRHPRLQDGEAPDRPAHRADGGRGRRIPPNSHVGANRRPADASLERVRRGRARPAAPNSRATCRCRAASSTASISRWNSCRSRTGSSPATGRGPDPRDRQACGRHRRRRYRLRLRRHLEPPGRASVTQFELLPQPPEHENKPLVWPNWPIKLRTSSSHEEGCSATGRSPPSGFEGKAARSKS